MREHSPLRLAKVPKEEIDRKVEEAARTLDLAQHIDRRPANLSGGQQQRSVSLTIVRDPKAFLMDDAVQPLDAKLRQMQLGLADRGEEDDHGVCDPRPDRGDDARRPRGGDAGSVLQQGQGPGGTVANPVSLFVAGFIGSPAMNFDEELSGDGVEAIGDLRLPVRVRGGVGGADGGRHVIVGIRPESFEDAELVGGDARDHAG